MDDFDLIDLPGELLDIEDIQDFETEEPFEYTESIFKFYE